MKGNVRSFPLIALVSALAIIVLTRSAISAEDPLDSVDPFIGTGRTPLHSATIVENRWSTLKPAQGNLHPGPVVPFGLVSAVPYGGGYPTGYWRGEGGRPCSGFTHFQQSGTGAIRHYYNFFLVSPIRGALTFAKPAYVLTDEYASPGLYRCDISASQIEACLTVTRRAAFHQYCFRGDAPAHLVIDLAQAYDGPHANGIVTPSEANYRLDGRNGAEGVVVIDGIPLHFCVSVQGNVLASGAWAGNATLGGSGPFGKAPGPFGLWFSFAPGSKTALLKVAFSFRSAAQARDTMANELPSWDFAAAVRTARQQWQNMLDRFHVEGGSDEERTLFYTAIYRSLIKPADATGENPNWDNRLPWYVDFATLWDTYKTQMPLIMTFYPERGAAIANALVNIAQHQGSFPVAYLLPNTTAFSEQGVDFAQLVLADAYAKYVPGINWREILPILFGKLKQTGKYPDTALQYSYASACLVPLAVDLGVPTLAEKLRLQAETWPHALSPVTHKLPPVEGAPFGRAFYEGGVWNYEVVPESWTGRIVNPNSEERSPCPRSDVSTVPI